MAAPDFLGIGLTTYESGSGTTLHEIKLPDGMPQIGEALVCWFVIDGVHDLSIGAGSGPGWSIIAEGSDPLGTVTGCIARKLVTDGNDALVIASSGSERSAAITRRLSPLQAGLDILVSALASADGPNSDTPSLDTGLSRDYKWVTSRHGDGSETPSAPPTNYTDMQTHEASGGGNVAEAHRDLTAQTEDPGAWAVGGEQWAGWTIAIPPKTTAALAPSVNALSDVFRHLVNTEFARTALEWDNGAAISSREWRVISGPDEVNDVISTAALLEWTPSVAGLYQLRYTAVNANGTSTDHCYVAVIDPLPGRQVTVDTFERVLVGEWGEADHGGTWHDPDSRLSVSDGRGRVTFPTNGIAILALDDAFILDSDVSILFAVDKLPNTNLHTIEFYCRRDVFAEDASNFYRPRVRIRSGGEMDVRLEKQVADVTTVLVANTNIPNIYVPGTQYRADFQARGVADKDGGTRVRFRVYPADELPPAWQIDVLHSEPGLDVPGTVGLRIETLSSETNFPFEFSFDDLRVSVHDRFATVLFKPTP